MSEKDRQKELARLRHQFQKSQREERFGAAALVLGLTERNARMGERFLLPLYNILCRPSARFFLPYPNTNRFESDKKRQEELAKQRIAALKSKLTKGKGVPMTTISEEDEKIVRDGTKEEMMVLISCSNCYHIFSLNTMYPVCTPCVPGPSYIRHNIILWN